LTKASQNSVGLAQKCCAPSKLQRAPSCRNRSTEFFSAQYLAHQKNATEIQNIHFTSQRPLAFFSAACFLLMLYAHLYSLCTATRKRDSKQGPAHSRRKLIVVFPISDSKPYR